MTQLEHIVCYLLYQAAQLKITNESLISQHNDDKSVLKSTMEKLKEQVGTGDRLRIIE